MEKEIKNIILLGENVNTELKEAKKELPKNLFETVCSFLNTTGGYIILGVNDKKEIIGIDKDKIDKIKKDYTSRCNNKEIINPTIISELKELNIDDKIILYTHIEESNEIHKHKNKIFIRNYEGDFDITNNISLLASIHNHKRKIFDEDTIYPHISIEEDLRHDLIEKARRLANTNVSKRHVWADMNDLELLKSAGLYKIDKTNKKEGITLAGIMLFGKDEVIRNINPYCRTDAIYRVDDLERYDDRDFIETNLLDMYERLLDFITKYTMDRFALNQKMRRISPRNIMAREMVINTLMHRSLTDGHTSRIIIYKDKIICENPNSFGTMTKLSLENYTPFAKNPTLAKFFREIGYAEELGSGVKRITENSLLYSGKKPVFEDKEMFRLTIPLSRYSDTKNESDIKNIIQKNMNDTLNDTLNENLDNVLYNTMNSIYSSILQLIIQNPKITIKQISKIINKSEITTKRYINELKIKGYIERIGSKKTGEWNVLSEKIKLKTLKDKENT